MLKIEIWIDVMCPFSYIGNKNLKIAVEMYRGNEPIEVWHKVFELNPNKKIETTPPNPIEYIHQSKGVPIEKAKKIYEDLSLQAKKAGLPMNIDSAKVVNSFDALRLIKFAEKHGKSGEMKDLLFISYFAHGKNLADRNVLADLAQEIGLDKGRTFEFLSTEELADTVQQERIEGLAKGLEGVPYIVVNDKYKLSGIRSPQELTEILNTLS